MTAYDTYTQLMPKRSSNKRQDIKELASVIVEKTTIAQNDNGKNPDAVALGRLGSLKGGKARADKLTPERRKEIAKKAAQTRWGKQDLANRIINLDGVQHI